MLDEVFRIGEPEEREAFSGLPPRRPDFLWLDVTAPTREELDALTKEHGLPASSVHDCLEPFHLPKVERISEGLFVLLRAFDETSAPEADTMQALTRKLAVFWRSGLLVTVHRKPQRFLLDLKLQLPGHLPGREPYAEAIGLELASGVLQSYRVSPGPDHVLVIQVADMARYQALAQRLFGPGSNVRNVRTYFVVARTKFETRITDATD